MLLLCEGGFKMIFFNKQKDENEVQNNNENYNEQTAFQEISKVFNKNNIRHSVKTEKMSH